MKTKEKPISKTSAADGKASVAVELKKDELKMIRRLELFPDPDQPRKTFSEDSLLQLGQSIMEQGLVQPLIVRFVPAKYKISDPDLTTEEYHVHERAADGHWDHAFQSKSEAECQRFAGEANLKDRYVIIAGERRWRATVPMAFETATGEIVKWKGLEELPCVVRDVDARRKFAQQLIENNQREGVSAIEEAEALEREYKRRRDTEPDLSKEAFAREVGMSRADFYGTLVLTRLHPPVREALTAGKITASLAKVVAMVPEPKQQEKLLKHLTNEQDYYYPFSVRDAQEIVDDEYVKNLNDAPFKKTDSFPWNKDYPESVTFPKGNIESGAVMTCEACPHRSGNMTASFPDLATRPNVCTNTHCFAVKCKAHWLSMADKAKTAGKTVLMEGEFRKLKTDYIAGDKYEYTQGRDGTMEQLMGKHKPEPVLVATKEGLEKFYKKEEAGEACKKNGVKFHRADAVRTPEEKKKAEEKEKLEQEVRARRAAFVSALAPELLKAIAKLKDKTAWEAAALLYAAYGGNQNHEFVRAMDKEKAARTKVLGRLLGRHWPLNWQNEWEKNPVEAWALIGIDLKARFADAEKAVQKTLALPAKKELEQGKLLEVKRNKKKGGKR